MNQFLLLLLENMYYTFSEICTSYFLQRFGNMQNISISCQ